MMATPRELYDAKIREMNQKIKKFEEANKKDHAVIPLLERDYKKAIDELDIEKADEIHAKMDRLKRTAESRKEQIKLMDSSDHPQRQKAMDEYLEDLRAEEQAIKDEAAPLYEEIRAAREAYLEIVVKALPVEERFFKNAQDQHRAKFPKDAMTIVPHGLPGSTADACVAQHHIANKDREVRKELYAKFEADRRALHSYR